MKLFLLLSYLLMNSPTWAAKVGIVNMEKVIINLKIYEPVNKVINKLIKDKNAELNKIKERIQNKEKILKSGILTRSAQIKTEQELDNLAQEKDEFIEQAQAEVDLQEKQMRYPVVKQVIMTIKQISKEKKYDIIIDDSSIILDQQVTIDNLTEEIILRLNK